VNSIKKWINDIVTEPDCRTVCPVRIAAITGILQYQGLALAHYIQHHVFDAQPYAIGFGALLGGAGVALGLKKDSPKT
jgi:hypothetical protein